MNEILDNELDFSGLEPILIKVPFRNKVYWLTDASADAVVKWRNVITRNAKPGPDGKPISYGNIADAEPFLVSQCLYLAGADGLIPKLTNGDYDPKGLVPDATIRKWPNRVQKALFNKLKKISDMEEPETEESLKKTLEETKTKLNDLKMKQFQAKGTDSSQEEDDPRKNESDGTTDTSDSPEN